MDGSHDNAGGWRGLFARDGRAVLLAGLTTLVLLMGTYAAVRSARGERNAVLATLAVAAAWSALAPALLAAEGRDAMGAILRGGIVADAVGIGLLVLWLASDQLTFAAAVKVYLIMAAETLVGVAAVCCARGASARRLAAVLAACGLALALATPFWIGGLLHAAGRQTAQLLAFLSVRVNPFYAVTAAVFDRIGFAWDQAPFMYARVQQINDYASASPTWHSTALIHLAASALLAGVALIRGQHGAEDRSARTNSARLHPPSSNSPRSRAN